MKNAEERYYQFVFIIFVVMLQFDAEYNKTRKPTFTCIRKKPEGFIMLLISHVNAMT